MAQAASNQRGKWASTTSTTSGVGSVTVVGATSTSSSEAVTFGYSIVFEDAAKAARNLKAIEDAVYAHIRAIRALGRTRINTAEIAQALSVSQRDVDRAVENLKGKGVRRVAA